MNIANRNDAAAFTTKDTSTIREILAPRQATAVRQSLAEAMLAIGAATDAHSHPDTEEIYYILVGQGLIAIEAEQRGVGVGDGICIPPGAKHQIQNVGQTPLVFLCCCVPAYTDADTVLCEPLL